jgi:hypothetical protein
MNLNTFLDWQAAAPNRHVDIHLKGDPGEQTVEIWVWDTKLLEGQFVKSVEDIDLVAEKEKKERAKLAELSVKYANAVSGGDR